jgi:Cu+-exporting ATPase
MATGDGLTTARAVGQRSGIDEVHGEVKPAGQARSWWRAAGRGPRRGHGGRRHQRCAGAGEGADVGIAMGTGTDVAMNSAQVTLVKGDLRGIAPARRSRSPPSRT